MYIFPHNDQADSKSIEFGFSKVLFLLFTIIVLALFLVFKYNATHVSADSPKIYSGFSAKCVDDLQNQNTKDNAVDIRNCNNSDAQVWTDTGINIIHAGSYCLSVLGASPGINPVGLQKCDEGPNQIWLRDQTGLYNPNSEECLTAPVPDSNNSSQLYVSNCTSSLPSQQSWRPSTLSAGNNLLPANCSGTEGQRVACAAEHEYTTWQSGAVSHNDLLNQYTDGASYEEWCADFVSYVYKEAGYPFTGGETNGWDENTAGNIQNQGFTLHEASSGYLPKPGDVAFFSYSGGHVEIVISGGKTPTFIYGNSATIDPTTGNGEMESNTKLSDGTLGGIVYYLSPNQP